MAATRTHLPAVKERVKIESSPCDQVDGAEDILSGTEANKTPSSASQDDDAEDKEGIPPQSSRKRKHGQDIGISQKRLTNEAVRRLQDVLKGNSGLEYANVERAWLEVKICIRPVLRLWGNPLVKANFQHIYGLFSSIHEEEVTTGKISASHFGSLLEQSKALRESIPAQGITQAFAAAQFVDTLEKLVKTMDLLKGLKVYYAYAGAWDL